MNLYCGRGDALRVINENGTLLLTLVCRSMYAERPTQRTGRRFVCAYVHHNNVIETFLVLINIPLLGMYFYLISFKLRIALMLVLFIL